MTDDVSVETLSSPPINIPPAPLPPRLAAAFVDSIILLGFWIGALTSTGMNSIVEVISISSTRVISLAAIVFAYYFLQEWLFSATIGKRLFNLRVCDREGDPAGLISAFERNLLRLVDWLPLFYVVGATLIITSERGQRLGDRLAGTIVAVVPKKDINPPSAPFLFH